MRLKDVGQYRKLLEVAAEERVELTRWAQSRTLPAGDVFRARIILGLADGLTWERIASQLNTTGPTIWRWKNRFEKERMAGLEARHKGSKPRVATPAVQARVARRTLQPPTDGSTHWSCRKMAAALGLSKTTVQRMWAQARLKPHRLDRYMASDDPRFEEKAADIIGLYMNPPQHAAVFCVDEKTAIQALDRLDPVLPLSPGRAERHGFEYYRHGTLSLYAALDIQTGKVQGMTAARHTSADFICFLQGLVSRTTWAKEIHIVLDNLSAHKTKDVERFLCEHPQVRFHFTPTYSSWLNQVELWFAKIQRDVISRGVFTSVADLGNKLRRYIRAYSKSARPFRWTYTDPNRRIKPMQSPGQLTSGRGLRQAHFFFCVIIEKGKRSRARLSEFSKSFYYAADFHLSQAKLDSTFQRHYVPASVRSIDSRLNEGHSGN